MNSQATVTTKQTALVKLQTIEQELATTLIEREEVIRAALIALLTRQHLVILTRPARRRVSWSLLWRAGSVPRTAQDSKASRT